MLDPSLAAAVQVDGLHGVLFILAAILFLIGAVVAWFVVPRNIVATVVAAGLCLCAIAMVVT